MTGQGMSMNVTHRRLRTAGLAAGTLTLIAAVGVAITEAPPSGRSTPIGKAAPPSVRPNSVAINPSVGGGTDPRLQLRLPGRIGDARTVRGPQARLLGDTAGAVSLRGPQPTLAGRSADRGTVPGQQATVPGDTARRGTVVGAHVTLLGMVIGAQATLR
jgi:hypothetical protein